MNQEISTSEDAMLADLERLAAGELPEAARGPLLQWLEASPLRWRLFGLAALEAQTWSQALNDFGRAPRLCQPCEVENARVPRLCQPCEVDAASIPARPSVVSRGAKGSRVRRTAYALALAACVALSFTLGFALRGQGTLVPPDASSHLAAGASPSAAEAAPRPAPSQPANQPLVATMPVQSRRTAATGTLHVPVRAVDLQAPRIAPDASGLTEYVRAKWRRQGYDLNVERRFVFAKLADGTPIVLPIEQVSLQPITSPIH